MSNSTGSPLAPMHNRMAPRLVRTSSAGVRQRETGTKQIGEYKLGKVIGKGGNGQVAVGQVRSPSGTPEFVAIKQTTVLGAKATRQERSAFHNNPGAVPGARCAIQEAHLHAKCHGHPNIATAFDLLCSETSIFLVMELGENGDLFEFVQRDGAFGSTEGLALFRQLASAVGHMHQLGIAHRDIKPENVLLTNGGRTAMLTDFGCAVEFKKGDPLAAVFTGTPRCHPPEMFLKSRVCGHRLYDPKAMDVWSLGVVLFFMLTSKFPFECHDDGQTMLNILRGHFVATLPRQTPPGVATLLERMLHHDRTKRATMEEVMQLLDHVQAGATTKARRWRIGAEFRQ